MVGVNQYKPLSCIIVLVIAFAVTIDARTTEQVTRDIAIAGVVIAGVTFLMTCCICMGGVGLHVFRLLQGRDDDGRNRNDNTGGNSSNPVGIRSGKDTL